MTIEPTITNSGELKFINDEKVISINLATFKDEIGETMYPEFMPEMPKLGKS